MTTEDKKAAAAAAIKHSVMLPKTAFPMRAGLPKMEPKLLQRWQQMDHFSALRQHRRGAEKFILHDGPPYANGNLHIGHALNKILKDLINRFQSQLGKDANYVPGWDCHGLPIEWKIEEQYRKKKRDKDSVPIVEFRQECRDFAAHWMAVQSEEFQRLGVMGNWDAPYTTMAYSAEAVIAGEIGKFLMNGQLFRGAKPVLWSAVEKTALAEAEVEYLDHRSTTIYARFPVIKAADPLLDGATVVIWTTTPWTMPGNRAVAYGDDIAYGLYQVPIADSQTGEGKDGTTGVEKLILADALAETMMAECGISGEDTQGQPWQRLASVNPAMLLGTVLAHPLRGKSGSETAKKDGFYDHDIPLLPADFVTTEQGTGFVHIAPGHGADDYILGMKHGLPVPETVGPDGRLLETVPLFAGMSALKDNAKIADILESHGCLVGRGTLTHSYPHSWRSHAPLIFRNTPQWFISMEKGGLRQLALKALDETIFFPPTGQARLKSMIAGRPDWCISRQRAWGVPIPVFVNKNSGEPLRDQAVIDRIVEAFRSEGADAWFASPPSRFLGPAYDPEDWEQVQDIVDVWFDSGSTHAFLLEDNADMAWPADMYLEGTDQHRGWFHSSLLESCGTRGRAPYESVLTHGFVLDDMGRKMSKSLGNTVTPQAVIAEYGADILRLWVANSDYYDDLRIGKEIIQRQADHYRRLRNTLRYLLGNLDGYSDAEAVEISAMPALERWVLHRLWEIDGQLRRHAAGHDYHAIATLLHHFCNSDLSAFYLDIRKDRLYCDAADGPERQACRMVLNEVFGCLVVWLAPILCYTAEEAWLARHPAAADAPPSDPASSVHFQTWPEIPANWRDDALGERWVQVRQLRLTVNAAIEQARKDGVIKSSLQARAVVSVSQQQGEALAGLDAAEIFITSLAEITIDENLGSDEAPVAVIQPIEEVMQQAGKCDRCWKILPEVTPAMDGAAQLCGRCASVMQQHPA